MSEPSKADHAGATEGPWQYTTAGSTMSDGYSQPFAIIECNKPNLIAGCFGDVAGGRDVAEANARLIVTAVNSFAAAEQMAVALEAARKWMAIMDTPRLPELLAAERALSSWRKATGGAE